MKKTYSLTLKPRTITGHKVKHLRKSGVIPGSVYGNGFESAPVELNLEEFTNVYDEAGETNLVNVTLNSSTLPVLIHKVQQHPVTQKYLHVEFLKVNLKEKLKTHVPIVVTGESPFVSQGQGTLVAVLQEIEIEALPTNIPESITVDVTGLVELNQELLVKDLVVPADVIIHTSPDQTVVKVAAIVVEAEPEPEESTTSEGESATTGEEQSSTEETTKSTEEADKE